MDDLNEKLTKEFFKAAGSGGEPITFSPEEHKECAERYTQLSEEEGKMEQIVRKERVLSTSVPAVYLTF
jgi:hypothetical protein